jgi:hypothetical protein
MYSMKKNKGLCHISDDDLTGYDRNVTMLQKCNTKERRQI